MRLADRLFRIQQIDSRLDEIQAELEKLDRGDHLAAQLDALSKAFQTHTETLRSLRRQIRDAELELEDTENKIKQFRQLLDSGRIRSGREVEKTEKEIGELMRRKDQLEDRLLLFLEEAESLEKTTAEESRSLDQMRKELERVMQLAREKEHSLLEERQDLLKERADHVPSLDEEVFRRYQRIRDRLGGLAVAQVVNRMCSGCRVTLTSQTLRSLQGSDDLVTCENCGRYLYLARSEGEEP